MGADNGNYDAIFEYANKLNQISDISDLITIRFIC